MLPANPFSSVQPIPNGLKNSLPNPHTPWNVSSTLFARLRAIIGDAPFKICEISSSDPEFKFILAYFEHQKPPGYSIKRVVCVHNPDQTQMFEIAFKNMEREASNPVFAPKGKQEEPAQDRAQVLSRWQAQVAQFSPVEMKSSSSRGVDICVKAKVLPLWHGSSPDVCQSVFLSGFTFFGKHHYFDENAQKGAAKSTDKGYFGSGIYFTNSARYASMYSSEGHLLLSWVSMREPYPVVNDKPHPHKGSDMLKLEGRMHYQNYNAHFVPVASIRPQDPKCVEYYPCYKSQQPAWDEFVVFNPAQTLPRFQVEIGVDFPKVVPQDLGTVGELLTLVFSLMDKPGVRSHPALAMALQVKVEKLLDLAENSSLNADDQKFLKLAKRLFIEGDQINTSVAEMLLKKEPAANPNTLIAIEKKPQLPSQAFGKAEWEKYFGDIGAEPPLRNEIETILQSPCPFFPGKKIHETHLLTLIPRTINGKPFNLAYLGELIRKPKQGIATQLSRPDKWEVILSKLKNSQPAFSYWVLLLKKIIPKSKSNKEITLNKIIQEKKIPYALPNLLEATTSILMHYFRTNEKLFPSESFTYIKCVEKDLSKESDIDHLSVGGFDQNGFKIFFTDLLDDYHTNALDRIGVSAVLRL